jgi:chaperonin GroES
VKVRPINDWILVKLDPINTQVGSIIIPEGVDNRTATVVSTGPGKELKTGVRQPTGVELGDRVLFSRACGEHLQGKRLLRELGDDTLLLKPEDILVVFEGDVVVG